MDDDPGRQTGSGFDDNEFTLFPQTEGRGFESRQHSRHQTEVGRNIFDPSGNDVLYNNNNNIAFDDRWRNEYDIAKPFKVTNPKEVLSSKDVKVELS